ncbi:hypothetical protein [Thioclava pacifica]|uniref:hypothetical protein n=1 Tax=Thioclava pacifica TaxID=285109 RepID=UPI001F0A5609|nr:hypothetical protein [Thioclava pacifica]
MGALAKEKAKDGEIPEAPKLQALREPHTEVARVETHPVPARRIEPAVPGPVVPPRPARRSAWRLRHTLLALSFVLFVLVPTLGAATYLWGKAADQFVSRLGFTVQREEAGPTVDLLGGLSSLSGSSSSDTDILHAFIQSPTLVTELDAALDLRAIWSRGRGDYVFGLAPDATLEDLVAYWGRMVRVGQGAGAGLLDIEVRAFDPTDAQRIAQALLDRSSEMINRLSAIAREDAIAHARGELDRAEARLSAARMELTDFRNTHQLISPEMDLQSQAGVLGTLEEQQAQVMIDIDLLRDTVRNASDPRLKQAERRLAVIEERIRAEREKLGIGQRAEGAQAYADIVGEFERLMAERDFAERAYAATLANYDAAAAEARRKSRYLAAYMEPTLAESAEYPRRAMLLAMVAGTLFLLWAIGTLAGYSVRDRR